MKNRSRNNRQPELYWPRVVLRKWLNISTIESDYSADTDDDNDSDTEELCQWPRGSQFKDNKGEGQIDPNDALPSQRRRKSETFRAQYISTKELRICAGTWNVGGKLPPDDLDIEDWLDISEPADMYVIGFQEIIPLNPGNIFGAEDSRPVPKWENIIRETLNKIQPKTNFKCYSDPPSPSRFKPTDDAPYIEDEIVLETDSEGEEEIHPLIEESDSSDEVGDGALTGENMLMNPDTSVASEDINLCMSSEVDLQRQFSSSKKLDKLNRLRTEECAGKAGTSISQRNNNLAKTFSMTERIGLNWPDPPLDLLAQSVLERPSSFKSVKPFKASGDNRGKLDAALLPELDLGSFMYRKRRAPYVRIVSKQMVGIFLTIWVHRGLRRYIQNLKVSTVGVGVMGYIGNKGSISVSMSIYQTLFCFICTHLTSGEKDGDNLKRNADVQEIHRRTRFHSVSGIGRPKRIFDHERIIWLGDLNYRINLSYEKTRELLSKKYWSKLVERDQLIWELKKGHAFDGWSEGILKFPPTYKYELNSEKYYGEDPKAGRRTPAWCDRILSFGKGTRLLSYRRTELRLSDHRPVTASYMVEVEVFCPRKLQKALTFTDAEIESEEVVADVGIDVIKSRLRLGEDTCNREH